MSQELCRLCLSPDELAPIFRQEEQWKSYSDILVLTTGLLIELNDGLPQKICRKCTDSVNQALQLRNQAQSALQELNQLASRQELVEDHHSEEAEMSSCHEDIPYLEVKVECDRITDQIPEVPAKQTKKEKREMYMSMVDGSVEPNCPVKCKVCKKVLANWATFLGHAKMHLGLKYICELHERRVHTHERPYVCDVCGASYFSRRCLVQHLEGHATIASVQCGQCSRMFRSRRHLSRHTYSAHASKLYQYRCPVCRRLYRNAKYARGHLRKHHAPGHDKVIKIKL